MSRKRLQKMGSQGIDLAWWAWFNSGVSGDTKDTKEVKEMGYYTWHELEHDANEDHSEEIRRRIEEDDVYYAIRDGHDIAKWYEHDKDMLSLSLEFPSITFILIGEGEESLDFWKTKYKEGRMANVQGVIVYPAFGQLS